MNVLVAGSRRAACIVALTAALAAAASSSEAPHLTGPLSDFWPRVKQDWSRRLPGLNHGPGQTFIWVAMIWEGPDDLAIDDLVDELQEREAGRWVRSQITKHRWSSLRGKEIRKMQAFRNNVILIGTPEENDLVRQALEATPLKVSRGGVTTTEGSIEGDGLLVMAITPNPVSPRHYALVITGTSPVALVDSRQIPYGASDYIIYRGRRMLERGFFHWIAGAPSKDRLIRTDVFTEHFNWSRRSSAHCTIHFDKAATPPAEVDLLGRRMDAELEASADFFGLPPGEIGRIHMYVYASLDEKVRTTGDARLAHVERASRAIHAVHREGLSATDPSLGAGVLLSRSPEWGAHGERELPGLAFALSLACCGEFQNTPLTEWAARSRRDPSELPMDLLMARKPPNLESGDLSALDAAAFARHLIQTEGPERVARFYRTALRSDFHGRFREIFGLSIRRAESDWLDTFPRRAARKDSLRSGGAPPTVEPSPDRVAAVEAFRGRDHEAAVRALDRLEPDAATLTMRARIHFRSGRFELAVSAAAEALDAQGGTPEDRAWARVTLGRAHAAAGRLIAAAAELRQAEIVEGPEHVRILADYWLTTMGRPLNHLAVQRILMQEAEADLMNFKWDEAEEKLRILLAADPLNREAHVALSEVYLSKYHYWYDWILLDRELFPGISDADPLIYKFLADKGERELRLAESLPAARQEAWPAEPTPFEPGLDRAAPHFLRGKGYFLKGDLEAAQREMETALALEPRDVTLAAYCRLYLGRIAASRDDLATARDQFAAIVRMKTSRKVTALAEEALKKLDALAAAE